MSSVIPMDTDTTAFAVNDIGGMISFGPLLLFHTHRVFTIDWMMMLVLVLSFSPGGSTHCYNQRWFIRAYLCSVFRITP